MIYPPIIQLPHPPVLLTANPLAHTPTHNCTHHPAIYFLSTACLHIHPMSCLIHHVQLSTQTHSPPAHNTFAYSSTHFPAHLPAHLFTDIITAIISYKFLIISLEIYNYFTIILNRQEQNTRPYQ